MVIRVYSQIDSYFSDEDEQIEIKGKYLPGYASFQRSVDRYLIGEKRNISRSAYQVGLKRTNHIQYETLAKQWLNMLSDEELEEMKPYGEAFIREQDYMPQSVKSVPFPTDAYVSDHKISNP